MKTKHTKRGMPLFLFLLACIVVFVGSGVLGGYTYIRQTYTGKNHDLGLLKLRELDPLSLEYKLARGYYTEEELKEPEVEVTSASESEILTIPRLVEEKDKNGDGVIIEHIYGGTYEGYMMIVKNPEDVSIAINPHMGSGAAAPELEDYVEMHDAIGGINGGGFADAGGTGNGSIPAGIVIMDGKVISGAGSYQPILGITKDHKLVTTTCSPQDALDLGVVEAVTFGPTFITNWEVVYRPGTDNLNMLNPRTAVGQQEDGTFLLLVIDGRGPSSFGAKYEDVVEIFRTYGAMNAGNLDGGNSSVMIYNGKYIHYPVSMYTSRNLPSVVLVGAKK